MKLLSVLSSVGVGAALVYFLDPVSGNRRRALVREGAQRRFRDAQDYLDTASRDLMNRSKGVIGEMRSHLQAQKVSDDLLVRRVAAKLGHHVIHAKSIGITADNGCVTLQGPILRSQVDDLIEAIQRVPGVKEIRNELEIHETPDIPELQGGTTLSRKRWTPGKRLAVGSAGLVLAVSTRTLMRGRTARRA